MALADFFPRDVVAISQVLQGFETDAFTEKLEARESQSPLARMRLPAATGVSFSISLSG